MALQIGICPPKESSTNYIENLGQMALGILLLVGIGVLVKKTVIMHGVLTLGLDYISFLLKKLVSGIAFVFVDNFQVICVVK